MIRRQKPRKAPPAGRTYSVPAPVGGLNARDSVAAMPETDAVTLDNFFPGTTTVGLRRGFIPWATGLPADVESLMTWNGPSSSKQFAASGTAFYDVTANAAVGAPAVTGLANARWQHENMGTPGGQFLLAVNGTDYPRAYTGSEWLLYTGASVVAITSITRVGTLATLTTSAPHNLQTGVKVTITGTTPAGFSGSYVITVTGASTFTYVMAVDPGGNATVVGAYAITAAITGVDPRNLIHVNKYASRVYFIEKDSCRFWYLPVNSIGGAALSFDLAPLFSLGGYLMAMATWTIDNAAGVQEYAIFISSEGEVVMYSGSDPAVAASWIKNGRYVVGRPVGRRCYVRKASDVVLLTTDGFLPLSAALVTDRQQNAAISDKITNLVSNDLENYAENFGWQPVYFPSGNKLLVNVPQVEGATQYQYVMNTITGAWCRFVGWKANCFETLGDGLYFGSNLGSTANSAYVGRADYGFSDNGGYIFGTAKTAFSYFGMPGRQKQITMARPVFRTNGRMTVTLAMDMDFADRLPVTTPTFSGTAGTLWNTGLWNTFPWSSGGGIKKDWQGVTGVGDAGALHMRIANNRSAADWQSVTYLFKPGGVL